MTAEVMAPRGPRGSRAVSVTRAFSAASNNATVVKATPGVVHWIDVTNTNAAIRYFKLYNKATAPTVGTDVPVATYLIPATTGVVRVFYDLTPLSFSAGIGFALVTGLADTDNTSATANDTLIHVGWS